MQKFIIAMSRYITVKQVCREEIEAADEDEVNEILAETDEEDWDWEDYDVMDTGGATINSVTPDKSEDEDDGELDDDEND